MPTNSSFNKQILCISALGTGKYLLRAQSRVSDEISKRLSNDYQIFEYDEENNIVNKEKAAQVLKPNTKSIIHYRSVSAALDHISISFLKNIPYIVDFKDFFNPLDKEAISKVEKEIIRSQYQIIQNAFRILVSDKSELDLIENWFVLLHEFGGGQFKYNYDNALKAVRKCVVVPLLLDEEVYNPSKIKKSKMLWMGAVHGIDPDKKYFSVSGRSNNWTQTLTFFKELLLLNSNARLLVIEHKDPDNLRSLANNFSIPSSYLVDVNPSEKDLASCLNMVIAHIDFQNDYDIISTIQQLLGKPIITKNDVNQEGFIYKNDKNKVTTLFARKSSENIANQIKRAQKKYGLYQNLSRLERVYLSSFEQLNISFTDSKN